VSAIKSMARAAMAAFVLAAMMWDADAQQPADELPHVQWDEDFIVHDLNADGYDDIVQIGDTYSYGEWIPEESGVWVMNGFDGVVSLLEAGSYVDLRVMNRRLQALKDGLPQIWETVYLLRGALPPFRIAYGEPNPSNRTYRGRFVFTTTEPLSTLLLACKGYACEQDLVVEIRVKATETQSLLFERRASIDDPRLKVVGQTWIYTPTLWTPSWSGWGLAWDVCIAHACASQDGGWSAMEVEPPLASPDMNGDGVVNTIDLGMFKAIFMTDDPRGDFNGDGIVNVLDLGLFKQDFLR